MSKSLTSINLSYNNLGSEGGKAIAQGISVSKSLTEINLGGNNLGPEGAKALGPAISVSKSLTSIDLSENISFSDRAQAPAFAKAIAEGIAVSKSLTSIDLSANWLGQEGNNAIAEAWEANTAMHVGDELDAHWNELDPHGDIDDAHW